MKKQYLVASFIISSLLVPVLANAATADEIKAQIQSLLSQITALQQQLSNLTSGTPTTVSTSSNSCPNLYRALSRGSRGSDVISLQQFLIAQGLLNSDSATGFFGSMTEAAVQKWQAQNSIVANGDAASTGYGVVGARTRAAIAARCGTKPPVVQSCPIYNACPSGYTTNTSVDANGCTVMKCTVATTTQCPVYNACPSGYSTNTFTDSNGCTKISCTPVSQPTGSFAASQTSGTAPLTVTFSGSSGQGREGLASEIVAWIDFGDGTVDDSIGSGSFSKTHTYASAGTYTAKLAWRNFGPASSNYPTNTVGTATITVSGQVSTTPTIRVVSPNGGETYNAGSTTRVQWDASNIPATTYVSGSQVSYKIGLTVINSAGNVVGYISSGGEGYDRDLFDGTARIAQWDPASLSGGFSPLNQLKVRASVIKRTNQCVSAAAAYSSLATSQTACISEETVASDDSDGWFSVRGATVCTRDTPSVCTQS